MGWGSEHKFALVLVPLDRSLGVSAHVDFALRLSCPGFRLSLPRLPPWASRPPAASRPQTTAPPGQPTPSLPWPTASACFFLNCGKNAGSVPSSSLILCRPPAAQYPPSGHLGLTRQDPRESLSPVIRGTTPPTERGPGGHTLCACTGPLWKTIESSGSSRSSLCAMVLVPWHGVILHGPWGHRLTAI